MAAERDVQRYLARRNYEICLESGGDLVQVIGDTLRLKKVAVQTALAELEVKRIVTLVWDEHNRLKKVHPYSEKGVKHPVNSSSKTAGGPKPTRLAQLAAAKKVQGSPAQVVKQETPSNLKLAQGEDPLSESGQRKAFAALQQFKRDESGRIAMTTHDLTVDLMMALGCSVIQAPAVIKAFTGSGRLLFSSGRVPRWTLCDDFDKPFPPKGKAKTRSPGATKPRVKTPAKPAAEKTTKPSIQAEPAEKQGSVVEAAENSVTDTAKTSSFTGACGIGR